MTVKVFAYFAKLEDGKYKRCDIHDVMRAAGMPSASAAQLRDNPPEGIIAVYTGVQNIDVPKYHKLIDLQPELIDGTWWARYDVVSLSKEEIDGLLNEARVDINQRINEWREMANYSYFIFRGKRIACDRLSRSDIDGTGIFVATEGKLPDIWLGGWKAIDNSYVQITSVEDWREFIFAMYDQGQENFQHAQALKYLITLSTDVDFIRNLTWNYNTGKKPSIF
jgi:hypothetical protein